MTIHREIVRKTKKVEKAWEKVQSARNIIGSSYVRLRLFSRAKDLSDGLFNETKNLMPKYIPEEKLNGNPINTLYQLGGMKVISESIRMTDRMIPEVSSALQLDVSNINFKELEEKDRKFKPIKRLFKIIQISSVAVAMAGAVIAAIGTGTNSIGFGISLMGLFGLVGAGALKDHFEQRYVPRVKMIKQAIEDMNKGLEELQTSVRDMIEDVSFFSK